MAPAIPFISIGMGLFGTGMGAYGQYSAGKQQKNIGQLNALSTESEMLSEMESSREEYSSISGKQRSLYAKAGVRIDSGTPLLIYMNTIMKGAKEQLDIKRSKEQEAKIYRAGGNAAASAGKTAAAGTLITGIGRGIIDTYAAVNQ